MTDKLNSNKIYNNLSLERKEIIMSTDYYTSRELKFDDVVAKTIVSTDICIKNISRQNAVFELQGEYLQMENCSGEACFTRYGANSVEQIIDVLSCLLDVEFYDEHEVHEDRELQIKLGWDIEEFDS